MTLFGSNRTRIIALVGLDGALVAGAACPLPTLARETGARLVRSGAGTLAVTCTTPNPAAAETAPSVSTSLPSVTTPPLQVPPVTTGQLQIGSHTLGPYAVGGQTIPSMSIGGGTFGQVNSGAEVVGVGAVSCAAASVTNPGQTMLVSGSMHLDLSIEETDPSCATGFVVWSSQRKQLTPTPASAGPLASGVIIDAESGVPAAGQRDPHTGNTSDGLAEHYLGTSLFVNGTTQPTGIGCEDGDLDCAI